MSRAIFVCLATLCVWATAAQPGYTMEADILYRDESVMEGEPATEGMLEKCRLDLYYPNAERDEGFATVIWIHAGGLKYGDKYVPGELRNSGFAIAGIDYRRSGDVKAPAYIEDTAAAVAWVKNNIARYGGDPDRIVVAGASAGAYLAMMVGLDDTWLAAHGIEATSLLGIGALAGQTITHVAVREERGIDRIRPIVDELAPMYHVREDAPPLLLVTGDRELELLGRWEENALMARLMKLRGHTKTTLYELDGFDHAGLEAAAHPLLLDFILRWINE